MSLKVSLAWTCVLLLCFVPRASSQEPPVPADQILAVEPTTIEGNLDAALLMLRLARPELANRYLEQLLALDPQDEDLLALRVKYGTSTFLELARVRELEQNATRLLDLLNAATIRHVSAPGYVDRLLLKLSGTPRERDEALNELRQLGPYAIPPMLLALQNNLEIDRDAVLQAMTRLGADSVPALIGALQSPVDVIRTTAATVLGVVGEADNVIWLWHPAYLEGEPVGVQQAARRAIARLQHGDPRHVGRVSFFGAPRRMLDSAIEHLTNRHPWSELLYGDSVDVPVWTWDAELGTVTEHRVSRKNASIHFAERLAREAAELAPANEDAAHVFLAARLARDVEAVGWGRPLPVGPGTAHDLAVLAGPETCSAILRLSLDLGIVSSALGSLQALSLNGSRSMLQRGPGEPPILAALNAPHPRLQFAATMTILEWEPRQSFPGAHRVVEILARAMNAEARAASIVMDPNLPRGTTTAAMFGELGFRAALAQTGAEGFRVAAERGNVELAVLHPNVVRWELSQTLANLRADARTASIPVVIYGPAGAREDIEQVSAQFKNVAFVNEATTALDVNRELGPLLSQLSPPPLTQAQRSHQIAAAAFWLRRIATSHQTDIFDLAIAEEALSAAINNPNIAEDAVMALSGLGRPSVQRRLLDTATSANVDANLRRLAALQLAFSIQRFGLLLTEQEIRSLRQAWETEQEPSVRTSLASAIGSLRPTPQAVRRELLSVPRTPTPIGATPPPANE